MTATNQNARVYSGDYKELYVPVRDPAGDPIDPEKVTAQYKVAVTKDGASALCIDALVSKQDDSLYLTIILTPTITNSLAGMYYHEIEVIDATLRRFTVLTGTLWVIPTLICEDQEEPEEPEI